MVENTEANRKKCVCPRCPSYPRDCKGELLFCSIGKSSCDISAKGCICNACPVYFQYKLTGLYFCSKTDMGEKEPLMMRKRASTEDPQFYQAIVDIKNIAASGESIIRSMGSQKRMPFSFDDLHFIPAQVHTIPLNKEDPVNTSIVIGPKAKKPLKLSSPILVSGMSFGAVSRNVRLVIANTASRLKIGFNPGEGGVLDEELSLASPYIIGQYATGRFGVEEKTLKRLAAIELRFGQGAYPGKGSYLPAEKMTSEVAKARGLKAGEAAYSPAHHPDIKSPKDVKDKVSYLRTLTGGVPIGAKIGCGNIELDIKALVDAGVDFISIDGFGGGTGATNPYIRDNVGLPLIAALPRASSYLESIGAKDRVSLLAGGGLRTSADFAKCLALGADAVYIGTAAIIAINCEQYRICHTGLCPTGVTTHNPVLTKELDIEKGISRLSNFLNVSTEEVSGLARVTGKDDVSKLDITDLVALKRELAALVRVKWLGGN